MSNDLGVNFKLDALEGSTVDAILRAVDNSISLSVSDKDGVILYINDEFAAITKYDKSELIGKNHSILSSGYHPKSFYIGMWDTLKKGEVWRGEVKDLAKDGTFYWVDTTIAPIKDNDNIVGYISLRTLITERKNQEAELLQFKLAVGGAFDHMVIADPEGKILFANEAVTRITGYERSEVIGTKAGKLWGGLMPPEFYQELWKTIRVDKRTFSGEVRNRRKNGEIYFAEVNISPVLDDEGNIIHFVGIERDVTRTRQVEQMKSEFITMASHQLRTPLTSINWYLEMLKEKGTNQCTDEQKTLLDNITHSVGNMNDLVQGLLNVSRIESGRIAVTPDILDYEFFLNDRVSCLRHRADEKKVTVYIEYKSDQKQYSLDKNLMTQLIDNLLTNAIKYNHPDGSVYLRVYDSGENFVTEVSDNGIGISDENRGNIFDKFFRTESAQKIDTNGNGLGLYIVKMLVALLKGEIWFTSKIDQGTSFFISLPKRGMTTKKGEVSIASEVK